MGKPDRTVAFPRKPFQTHQGYKENKFDTEKINLNRFTYGPKIILTSILIGMSLALTLTLSGCGDPIPMDEILTVQQIEQIVTSTGADTVCLEDDTDSTCLTVVPQSPEPEPEPEPAPVLHIHAENLTYVFFYEEKPILLAEAVLDTVDTVRNLLQADDPLDIDIIDPSIKYWRFYVYYPDSRSITRHPLNKRNVRAVGGSELIDDTTNDLKITKWKRHDATDAETDNPPDISFTLETDASELTLAMRALIANNTVTFYINTEYAAADPDAIAFDVKPVTN